MPWRQFKGQSPQLDESWHYDCSPFWTHSNDYNLCPKDPWICSCLTICIKHYRQHIWYLRISFFITVEIYYMQYNQQNKKYFLTTNLPGVFLRKQIGPKVNCSSPLLSLHPPCWLFLMHNQLIQIEGHASVSWICFLFSCNKTLLLSGSLKSQ